MTEFEGEKSEEFRFPLGRGVPPPGEHGRCSTTLSELGASNLERLASYVSDEWTKAKVAKSKNGAKVLMRPMPGTSSYQVRAEMKMRNVTAEQFADALMYENRIQWDPAIKDFEYLRRFAGGTFDGIPTDVDVVAYRTSPGAGGLVSSRGFVDVRVRTQRKNGILMISSFEAPLAGDVATETRAPDYFQRAVDAKGIVRARNLAGSGTRLTEIRQKSNDVVLDICMVTASDLGGMLPSAIVNPAVASAFHEILLGLARELQKFIPNASIILD